MQFFDESKIKNISYPDADVEKIEFFPQRKILNFFVDCAWLDENEGIRLGKGTLFLSNWDSILVTKYDSQTNLISIIDPEPLKDICQVFFSHSSIMLCGFGKETGQWIEWRISNPKMHAEFQPYTK